MSGAGGARAGGRRADPSIPPEDDSAPSGLRTLAIRLLLLFIVFGLVFAIGEVATRLFVPESIWALHDAAGDWDFDQEVGWVQTPNADISRRHIDEMVRFQTNVDGLQPQTAARER